MPIDKQMIGYLPRIVIKVRDNFMKLQSHGDDAGSIFYRTTDKELKEAWANFQSEYMRYSPTSEAPKIEPVFRLIPSHYISVILEKARLTDSDFAKLPDSNLLAYFFVNTPFSYEQIESLVCTITNCRGAISFAYFDLPAIGAMTTPQYWDDTKFKDPDVNKNYLLEGGIDVKSAWNTDGGDGKGQTLVDFEQGWDLSDLIIQEKNGQIKYYKPFQPAPELISGDDAAGVTSKGHGRKVLGVICAKDDLIGWIGIAPKLQAVKLASYISEKNRLRADHLLEAISKAPYGSVILIEAQLVSIFEELEAAYDHMPIEKMPIEFIIIRMAVALGFVVVAAAGDGIPISYPFGKWA